MVRWLKTASCRWAWSVTQLPLGADALTTYRFKALAGSRAEAGAREVPARRMCRRRVARMQHETDWRVEKVRRGRLRNLTPAPRKCNSKDSLRACSERAQ